MTFISEEKSMLDLDTIQGFDPLGDVGVGETEISQIVEQSQKRDVLNILRSYTGVLDVFSEAIQNAIDAVDARSRSGEQNYQPHIWITIDNRNSVLKFIDNGIGLTANQLKYFVRPAISFKRDAVYRGHKGVGATFLGYGYTSFAVSTKGIDGTISAVLSGGRQWAESSTQNIPRPRYSRIPFDVPELEGSNSGTCIEIAIGSHRDERPNLSWLNITSIETWFKLLRLKTPLGGVYLKTGGIKPEYHLSVVDSQGKIVTETFPANSADFYYPHEFSICTRNQDLATVHKEVARLNLNRKDIPQRLPANFRGLDCLWNIWDNAEIIDEEGPFFEEFDPDQLALIIQHDVHVYGCFVRSRTIWETFQKDEMKVRPQYKVMQGGMQLASDFMVQGDLFTIPLTTAQGYQSNSFIIIHFTNGNPDMGRKVFQPELKEIADKLSRRIVSELRKYQVLLKPDTGEIFANASKQLEDWRDEQKEWQRRNPLRLSIGGKDVALISKPREEQDVIALFHELIGMEVIRGLQFFSTGYNTRYDGLFKYKYEIPHRFDSEKNYWGVDPRFAPSESGALVIEYKLSADGLIRDFEKAEKSAQEIHLLVCWNIDSEYKKNFEIVSLMLGQEGATREYFGSTHVAYIGTGRATKAFEIVCLSDMVSYFEDPQATLAKQVATYSS